MSARRSYTLSTIIRETSSTASGGNSGAGCDPGSAMTKVPPTLPVAELLARSEHAPSESNKQHANVDERIESL